MHLLNLGVLSEYAVIFCLVLNVKPNGRNLLTFYREAANVRRHINEHRCKVNGKMTGIEASFQVKKDKIKSDSDWSTEQQEPKDLNVPQFQQAENNK